MSPENTSEDMDVKPRRVSERTGFLDPYRRIGSSMQTGADLIRLKREPHVTIKQGITK
jgi:hypothetical protein